MCKYCYVSRATLVKSLKSYKRRRTSGLIIGDSDSSTTIIRSDLTGSRWSPVKTSTLKTTLVNVKDNARSFDHGWRQEDNRNTCCIYRGIRFIRLFVQFYCQISNDSVITSSSRSRFYTSPHLCEKWRRAITLRDRWVAFKCIVLEGVVCWCCINCVVLYCIAYDITGLPSLYYSEMRALEEYVVRGDHTTIAV